MWGKEGGLGKTRRLAPIVIQYACYIDRLNLKT